MNPIEFRKIILIGYSVDLTEGAPLLGPDQLPIEPWQKPMLIRFAFWIPARRPYQRCAGTTEVINALPFERQALRDGAIEEHVQSFTFDEQPSLEEMRRRLMPVWEALTVDVLGVLPNGAPEDHKPKFALQFTAINQ